MIYQYKNFIPVIHESSFIHPQSAITGNVIIGKNVYIGPGAALRGDFGKIIIEDGCNVQENCTVHMFPGVTVLLKQNAHIGHGAVIHGATIGRNCLIGMNAVIMDNVILEDECIVGALSFVKAGQHIPPRSLMIGNPAKMIRTISDEMIAWKNEGTKIYQQLAIDMKNEWKACEPMREPLSQNNDADPDYKPWDERKRE
jgi:phenylacetic acid degradation protein